MSAPTLAGFYQAVATSTGTDLSTLLPSSIQAEVGHFNAFDVADLWQAVRGRQRLIRAARFIR